MLNVIQKNHLILIGTQTANAALTSKTSSILGNAPYFILSDRTTTLKDSTELLGFTMPIKNSLSADIEITQINSTVSSTAIVAIAGMKFSDVTPLVKANNYTYQLSQTDLLIDDQDGDASANNSTFSQGTLRGVWFNQKGTIIDDLEQPLSACESPYTLFLIANNVSANTTYGNPAINNYGSGTVMYTFKVAKPEVCYLKPLDLTVLTTGTTLPGGFNANVFDTTKGFIISGLKKNNKQFPTTGFKGVEFTLLGAGDDQSKYRCSVENGASELNLSGSGTAYEGLNCTIRYEKNTRFNYDITINMEYNDGSSWSKIGSYTIPKPTLWTFMIQELPYANQNTLSQATSFPALTSCSGQNVTSINDDIYKNRLQYMFRRNEITNSLGSDPIAYPEGTSPTVVNSQYSRDADGTFMGEWGGIYKYDYSSGNQLMFYWTAESYSDLSQFEISTTGSIYPTSASSNYVMSMCRG
ncbi:hypothetical protein [Orbus mooreae]|uniref:hypothetical protein n=1 Tax=Orbus mooreae TaxID=3074107 RepID=UPI00370DC212